MSPALTDTSLHVSVQGVGGNTQHLRKAVPHHNKKDRDLSTAGTSLAEVPHPTKSALGQVLDM